MPRANSNTKPTLRFAALMRVSTEKQEKQGESLRTQDLQIRDAVCRLGGTITRCYAGQEHATANWEREQLEQLLADAKRSTRPFDAVIVAHPDRWSRDNVRSETGLQVLQDNDIRFFILTQEQDLFDPTTRLYLSLSATIGAYQAGVQSKKSLENRIERAKRGWPSCGRLPYGRAFNRKTGNWEVKPKIRDMLLDVATRYLAGQSMAGLAREYGINHSFLHKTLTQRCGPIWEQRFRSAKLNISVTVPTPVPAMLDPEIIAAVQRRATANKTFAHGHLKNQYLFSRAVFCEVCGYALIGQTNPNDKRYYRHQAKEGAARCPLKLGFWVPADLIEKQVLADLAELWGNPKAVEKALADAEPNKAETDQIRTRLERIAAEQAKIKKGRDRILGLITKHVISDEHAEVELHKLNDREAALTAETDRLQQRLAGTLSPADRERLAQHVTSRARAGSSRRDAIRGAQDPDQMTWEQKRMLVEDVFGGTTPDGRRMGVYVKPLDTKRGWKHRRWSYKIHGRIQGGGTVQEGVVTNYAEYALRIYSHDVPFLLFGTAYGGNGCVTPR